MTDKALVLVDMDGVLADWGAAYDAGLNFRPGETRGIPRHSEQRGFDLFEGLTEYQSSLVREVMDELDYFYLDPIPGAIEAVQSMREYGHEVMICTSPWLSNPSCLNDKIDWVCKHLGEGWEDRVIITKDKTIMLGDVLIDDKPNIKGHTTPTWTQVIFDQPYNQDRQDLPRLRTWDDWDNSTLGGARP